MDQNPNENNALNDDKIRSIAEKIKKMGSASLDQGRFQEAVNKSVSEEDIDINEEKETSGIATMPLQTFEGDVADAVKSKKTSLVSIAVAEQTRKIKEESETEKVVTGISHFAIVLMSIILVILGAGSIFFFYYLNSKRTAPVPVVEILKTIIPAGSETEIDITGKNSSTLTEAIKNEINKNQTSGQIANIKLTKKVVTTTQIAGSQEVFALISPGAPASLVRALALEFMLGSFVGEKANPFLIIKLDSFDNAFPGMLKWEDSVTDGFVSIFAGENTGTTTIATANGRTFEDVEVKNVDTRTLKGDNGKTLLMYSFLPDKKTLLITTDENTFTELLTRYNAVKLLR